MSLSQKLLNDMATHGPTQTILNSVLKSLNRQKLDLRAYFEDPDSPAIVRTWAADPNIKSWITSAEEALEDSSPHSGVVHENMSHKEECYASIELMDPFFKKCFFGQSGLRMYQVVDPEKKRLSPIPRNDDEDFAITGVLKAHLRKNNCILPVRMVRKIKEWWLAYGEDIPRPKLCAQPEEDVWCQWRVPIRPDPGAIEMFNVGLSEAEALQALMRHAPACHSFFSRLSDPAALAAFHWGVYSGEYQGRQMPWIQGEGQDGKSKWMKAFSDAVFGGTQGVATVIQNSTLKNSAQFDAALLVDKVRLRAGQQQ
jgi:hypothetical protein